MAAEKFFKLYAEFVRLAPDLTRTEVLTFLWLALHADARGNMVLLNGEMYERLLKFTGVKRTSMYNVISRLSKRQLITKHGDLVMISAPYANKHRKLEPSLTPYNWSLTEFDF